MRRTLGGGVAIIGLAACRSPAQIDVTVSTDVQCSRLSGTSLTTGTLGEIEKIPPASTTTTCTNGYIGSIVIVPNGDDNALVGFKVVTGLDGQPVDQCAPDDAGSYGPRCIVSRRALRYLPHTPLTVQVRMAGACAGIACDPFSTCVEGACVLATIASSTACQGGGCGEGILTDGGAVPGDASALDGSPVDATLNDSSVSDAQSDGSPSADARADGASVDASVGDASVLGCDLGGLQAGAAWPMGGYCPARRGRSPLAGPTTKPTTIWRYPPSAALPGAVAAGPTVGADGTIYVATQSNHVVAVRPDGALLWDQSIAASGQGFVTEPVIARDQTIRLPVDGPAGTYAIFPLDGGTPQTHALQILGTPVTSAGGLTIVTGDTMYVCDTNTNLGAFTPQGALAWHVPGVTDENVRPAVDPTTGTIFIGNTFSTVRGAGPEGGVTWSATADAGAGGDMRGIAVAVNGTVRAYTGAAPNLVVSFDPSQKDAAAYVQWQQATSGAVAGLAIDDQGKTFVGTDTGLFAFTASGAAAGQYLVGACGPPVVDAVDNVLVWCNGQIIAVSPDLTSVLWAIDLPVTSFVNDPPVIGSNGAVYFTVSLPLGDGGQDSFLEGLQP